MAVGGITVLVALVSGAGQVTTRVAVVGLIQMLFVVSLYTFSGTSGVLSFGHMAFVAIGAYTTAVLTVTPELKSLLMPELLGVLQGLSTDPFSATLLSGALAGVVALLLAGPLMRLSGIGASLATLAVLVVINVLVTNLTAITNGASGISGLQATIGIWGIWCWVVLAVVVAFLFQRSRIGVRLRASRDDIVAARAVGISVVRERSTGWVLSAVLSGIAGSLYAQSFSSVTPQDFYIDATFMAIAMLVIGGMRSLGGAVLGAVLVTTLAEFLRRIEAGQVLSWLPDVVARPGLTEVCLAVLMLLLLMFRPDGITGGRELTWSTLWRIGERAVSSFRSITIPKVSERKESSHD